MTKRIELTIGTDYVPDWGLWEGVRELFNNGHDAETERNAPLVVDHKDGWLRVRNTGTTLHIDNLILGDTDKRGTSHAETIGRHGDGMKTGILAILRAGRKVAIRTGNEVWSPTIEASQVFTKPLLVFTITAAPRYANRVVVEIEMTREEWDGMRDRFLYLSRETTNDRVVTPRGTLLTAPRFKGRLYVKGVFVQMAHDLRYGYDLPDATLNRDRNVVESYDRGRKLRDIWAAAVNQQPDLTDDFFKALIRDDGDMSGSMAYAPLTEQARASLANRFYSRYGEGAVPVASLEESREIAHLGRKGVVVPAGLRDVLEPITGDTDAVKAALRQEVQKLYSWDDLNEREVANLGRAVGYVSAQVDGGLELGKVSVVAFRSADLLGQHKDGNYLLARKALASLRLATETLVHEVAHDHGGDGEKGHVAAIERIWSGIFSQLVKEVR